LNNKDLILKEKFINYYSAVFEEKLITEIIETGHFQKIKAGELLLDVGDDLTHIPLIFKGTVKVIRHISDDGELALYYLKPGNTCAISFINCIESKKSVFEVIIETDMEAVFVPVDKIDEWLVNYKSWRRFIIDSYHFRLMEMLESIDSLAFTNLNERLFKYLTNKVKRYNSKVLQITHQEIANDLNTSRVVVSRIIKQLQDEGKIISTRNKIKLFDNNI
jgi:CRP/FNR family transcriptional regulator, anaerobic regulatory protein